MTTPDTNTTAGASNAAGAPNASLLRRSAAILYDTFLVVAVWMLTTLVLIPLVADGGEIGGIFFQLLLYFEWFAFYYAFWRMKGQTLGMQVWKIKATDKGGNIMSTTDCIKRFILATLTLVPAGIGFFWGVFRRDNLTLYDQLSGTRVIYLGKNPYRSEITEPDQEALRNK